MSYEAAVRRLYALGQELHTAPAKARRKFDLNHMRVLMHALGDPQRKFPAILIAGTNGKGSTSATLAAILTQSGYRTGLYTSPHLSRVNERIQIDAEPIADIELAAIFFRVEEIGDTLVRDGRLPGMPSFFETMTAMGFLHFASQQVEQAVIEVGMGGRLDATNIVDPVISVITDISLDHMEWLGSTVSEIAREKAGILRRNGVMITLPQHPKANQALGEQAVFLNVRGVNAARYLPAGEAGLPLSTRNRYPLSIFDELVEIDAQLDGAHQRRNLALAVAAAVELRNSHGYNIHASTIVQGIQNTSWPGRLEQISGPDHAPVLLDVAHNPAGAWALRAAVSSLDEGQELTLVFGCLKDKPVAEMVQILFPIFRRIILTPVNSPRSASMEELVGAARLTGSEIETAENPLAAFERARDLTSQNGLIVVSGSVYLVGAVREYIATAKETVSR